MDNENYDKYGKFKEEKRTFETRVTFIRDIFTNKYEPIDVLSSSVKYKLGKSYEQYMEELNKHIWQLAGKDVLSILKRIDF